MAINFGKVGIYNEEFPSMKSADPLISCSGKVIKLGKIVTYYKQLPSMKSHNPLNTLSQEAT